MNTQLSAAETIVRDALGAAFDALKGIGAGALQKVVDEYAPQFARLATMDPSEAKLEYDALLVNLNLDEHIAEIEAQTAGVAAVKAVLIAAAGLARSMILPGFPSIGVA